MSKQVKVLVGSVFAAVAILMLTTGDAFAADGGGCGCCKKMDMPMPMPKK